MSVNTECCLTNTIKLVLGKFYYIWKMNLPAGRWFAMTATPLRLRNPTRQNIWEKWWNDYGKAASLRSALCSKCVLLQWVLEIELQSSSESASANISAPQVEDHQISQQRALAATLVLFCILVNCPELVKSRNGSSVHQRLLPKRRMVALRARVEYWWQSRLRPISH